jgi:hypothetical protein
MFPRTALTGLLAVAVAAILPAAATATVASSLAITQGNGATAGSTATTNLAITFENKDGAAPKEIAVTFPPGFLLNLGQDEGKCLASTAPNPACSLGTFTYTDASKEEAGASLYLVSPPTIGDVAGIALDNGTATTLGTAAVTLITTPAVELKVAFPEFPTNKPEGGGNNGGIIAAEVKLQSPRMPTACGAPLFFNLSTTMFKAAIPPASTNALLEVTGCSTLPYAPQIAATVTKVSGEEGADVAITLTQPNPEGEAATNSFEFGNPKGVKTNKVLAPCFKGATCTVGTVAANSPTLAPSELSSGELTLAGSIDTGNLAAEITGAVTMSFPPPFQFSVAGPINVSEHTITFLNLPDIPFSTLTYNFLGVPAGPAFVTSCEPSSTISATLSPQDGGPPVKVTGPVTNLNCPPPSMKPKASASLSGLVFGKPKLQIRAAHDKSAPDLASLSIGLPSGLSFSARALAPKKVCKGSAGHRKCKTSTSVSGLSLSGAAVKSARLQGGKLVVVFKAPAAKVSLTARGPLLLESSTLKHRANQHTTGNLPTHLRITDAGGKATTLSAE